MTRAAAVALALAIAAPAEAAAKRLRAARDRFRNDVQAILAKRLDEPEPAQPETQALGAQGGDGGLMADILRDYGRDP